MIPCVNFFLCIIFLMTKLFRPNDLYKLCMHVMFIKRLIWPRTRRGFFGLVWSVKNQLDQCVNDLDGLTEIVCCSGVCLWSVQPKTRKHNYPLLPKREVSAKQTYYILHWITNRTGKGPFTLRAANLFKTLYFFLLENENYKVLNRFAALNVNGP